MKKYIYRNFIILVTFLLSNSNKSIAQVQDNVIDDPGDIAIVSHHGSTSAVPLLAFVLLDNCPPNTVIKFTDEEYTTSTGPFNSSSEGELVWTSPNSSISRGKVIRLQPFGININWNGTGGAIANLGTVSSTGGFLMNSNDQVYAYIGTMASPTFLTAFGNLTCTGGSAGCIPSTLTSGITARNVSTVSPAQATYYTGSTICNGTASACAAMIYAGTWSASTGVTSYPADFTGSALPIELTFFEGRKQTNTNQLLWQTATETNNKGFDIETSKDGANFQALAFVKGHGTTSETQNYTFTHRLSKNESGILYYRLKQMDTDGRFEYSKIIVVRSEGKQNSIVVYPNPSNGLYTISLDEKAEIEQISLMTVTGQSIDVNISNNQLDLTNEAAGVYFLQVNGENIRLIKN